MASVEPRGGDRARPGISRAASALHVDGFTTNAQLFLCHLSAGGFRLPELF